MNPFPRRLARISACAALATGLSGLRADVWTLNGDLNAHDPAIFKESGTWWIGRTWAAGIGMEWSLDGHTWNTGVPIFQGGLSWWGRYNGNSAWTWAPSLVDYNGVALCYYAVSTFGSQVSAVGLATASSIANGDWVDQGPVVTSDASKSYNAIDPCFALDASGNPWLSFGSWFDGIHLTRLDPTTFKPTGSLYRIADNQDGIENSQIVWHGGYYYLFVSVGTCCSGAASSYHIVFGRATSITGPYTDENGTDMMDGGGTTLDAGDSRYIAPGGESILDDGNGWICARHELDSQNNYSTVLFINDLYWANGWPTYVAPAEGSAPFFTTQPASLTVSVGASVTFSAAASGSPAPTFQWQRNGADIAGANGSSFAIASVGTGDAGSYTVTATNAYGSVTSHSAGLTVNSPLPPASSGGGGGGGGAPSWGFLGALALAAWVRFRRPSCRLFARLGAHRG